MSLFLRIYYSLFTESLGLLIGYLILVYVSCIAFGQMRNFKIKVYLLIKQYFFLLNVKDL